MFCNICEINSVIAFAATVPLGVRDSIGEIFGNGPLLIASPSCYWSPYLFLENK